MSDVESPGLHVALSVKPIDQVRGEDGAVAVHVQVGEATQPFRVSVYLDGDLVDTWPPGLTGHEVRLPSVTGRHVVTARAIDAAGRWGGASMLFDLASS
jgi:hypothetical protein